MTPAEAIVTLSAVRAGVDPNIVKVNEFMDPIDSRVFLRDNHIGIEIGVRRGGEMEAELSTLHECGHLVLEEWDKNLDLARQMAKKNEFKTICDEDRILREAAAWRFAKRIKGYLPEEWKPVIKRSFGSYLKGTKWEPKQIS